jgi:hypothetical protein
MLLGETLVSTATTVGDAEAEGEEEFHRFARFVDFEDVDAIV